ncbi:hypothetical protein SAMN05444287_1095 [Octadecabacter temperatus]|jgi:hypothetical protein|uniref:Uncharacterized protein n=1 Tax=Octadecabacter temperatus TaxID=1458307 RepID=A0A0K0Y4Y0_9RHOB|nr:hypothetical protein [Octadecabacter temperatus]AKS45990.1 hypothetical protein OSB_14380 [Octadecabacter temperatus]SIO05134.1 hypothetical protein SAMN05444287_1095 [Octadecabacter temperatus]
MKNSTVLPVLVVITIVILTLTVMMSGRSNDPGIQGDRAYPHYACQINRYCEGNNCSDTPISFIAYLSHEDGEPRLELPRFDPRATLTETPDRYFFESNDGDISGIVTIFKDRGVDLAGTSGAGASLVEHFASGSCDRLVEP